MKAAVDRAPSRDRLLKGPGWLDHHTAVGLTFAVKTFAASLLALYIAFWAGLDDPRWAFLTVFVVSQPDSGLVLAKGFYRILGSIAGVIVTAALVFGLAQYGELFVTAVALWICFCNFAARAVRNFASYGFQLAGYTVAIVGIPAALEPAGAYPLVLARLTEILLGIICAALVSRLILVRELSPQFIEFVRALGRRADSYAAAVLAPDTDRERVATERAEFAKAYLDVQAMQHSTYFESAEARILDQPLRRLTRAAVELCTMAEAAASHRGGSHPHPEEITSLGVGISATNESQTEDDPMVSAMVCAADERDLRLARARLRMRMEAFERGEELPEPNVAYRLWSDPVPAVLIGIRSALAVAITSTLWFATAWPNGPAAVVVAAVVCSLLASMEQPDKDQLGRCGDRAHRSYPGFRDPVLPDAACRRLCFDGGRPRTADADLRFHNGAAAHRPAWPLIGRVLRLRIEHRQRHDLRCRRVSELIPCHSRGHSGCGSAVCHVLS
ncbi:Fusaric acid resistance protein family protein [Rhizobiales bacterium GAS113]|nr:Fusaric acid resistance protein family protein [Rhizobiales bacterium GAS113]